MKQKTRTEYSVINTSVAIVARIVAILMGFVVRVFFIRILGEGYVGINGLFFGILNILSLTELGAGTAIACVLYKPIAEGDIKKQQILMRMFQTFYKITALFILLIGLAIIPFLDILMKDKPDVNHIILIYLLYLLNSVVSYLFIYKKTLVDAYQMNYLSVLYYNVFLVIQDILQIIVLVTTGNFIVFLLIAIGCTLTSNVLMSRKADTLFPYLKETCKEQLSKEEKEDVFKTIKAIFMHKLGTAAISNTDNLLLSSFVGVVSAGIYSNYYLIIGSVRQVIDQAFQGVTASVGNFGATEKKEKVEELFHLLFFLGYWIYGVAGICLFELLNPFIEIAFGNNYVFQRKIVLILCINFFMNGTRKTTLIFEESMALFWYDRYKAIAEATLNLILSIVFVLKLEIFGVFLGTFCSMLLTSVWVEPYILYKHRFQSSSIPFFIKYVGMALIMAVTWFCTDLCCNIIDGGAVFNLLFRLISCIIVPNVMISVIYCKKKEWKASVKLGREIGMRALKKIGNR